MNPDFYALERDWMAAVQGRDTEKLEQILDPQFVCTSWSSVGELTSRREYLGSVGSAEFGCFEIAVDHVQQLGDTAVVRCELRCDCLLQEGRWNAAFLMTDVWIRRGDRWRAVSRHASVPLGQWPLNSFVAADQKPRSDKPHTFAARNGRSDSA
jgi:ketosteroid isomerase-like protein